MLEQVPIDDLQPGMYVNQVLEQTGCFCDAQQYRS